MRIVYIAFSGIPSRTAQSINVSRACSAMAELGHEVTLLVPAQHPERLSGQDTYEFYNLPDNFTVKYVPAPAIPGGRTIFTWWVALAAWRLRPDLVFSRHLGAGIRCARLGLPVIYELHAPIKGKSRAITRLARTGSLRLLVTHTEEIRRDILTRQLAGLAPERVFSIPNGRNPLSRQIQPKHLEKATAGYNIGYVGKLQAQKGMALIADLAARLPGHDFHLVGGDATQIQEWRAKMDYPNVHFHGYVPQSQVDEFIAAMDLCLLPNEPHPANPSGVLYSSPMKTLDYMAHGKAILATDLQEIREILSDREALLLPQGDGAAWATAVETLGRDAAAALGRAARARVEADFTMRARYARILDEAGFGARP